MPSCEKKTENCNFKLRKLMMGFLSSTASNRDTTSAQRIANLAFQQFLNMLSRLLAFGSISFSWKVLRIDFRNLFLFLNFDAFNIICNQFLIIFHDNHVIAIFGLDGCILVLFLCWKKTNVNETQIQSQENQRN